MSASSDVISLRRTHWQRSRSAVEAVSQRGLRAYAKSLPYAGGAFQLKDRHIRCIDGRLSGGLRLAGSGIQLGIDGATRFAQAAGATGVTYHRDCGAAELWARNRGLGADATLSCAQEFARQLAGALGLPCSEAILDGVPGFHDETVVYYDGTGSFDPDGCRFLPRGFVVTRGYFGQDPAYPLEEVGLAVGIALGDHGFGESFTPQVPLRLVAVGQVAAEVRALTAELQTVVGPYGGRVVVDGLAADDVL